MRLEWSFIDTATLARICVLSVSSTHHPLLSHTRNLPPCFSTASTIFQVISTLFSFDFARGGSISIGAHYGRRNFISGVDRFDFGEQIFELDELIVKQEWDLGFYAGVVIDSRVAFRLIKSLTAPSE